MQPYQQPVQKPNQRNKDQMKKVAKKYKLFTTSLHHQTGLFFENSTLHGIRYIAEDTRPFLERFLWFSCIAMGAVATVIIILDLWEKFLTNPTITGLDTDFHSWDVPFPAITICPENPGNESLISEYIADNWPQADNVEERTVFLSNLTALNYERMRGFVMQDMIQEDASIRDIILKLVTPCEETFHKCLWKGEPYNCCEAFNPVFTESGFCWAFNARHSERTRKNSSDFNLLYIEETDLKWAFQIDTLLRQHRTRMEIYIHNSDDMPGIDAKAQHVWDFNVYRISFSMKQTYTVEDAKQLSIKQRKCIYEDEVQLSIDHIYTYTACTRQCRMENAMKVCGCIPFFYNEVGNFRNCRRKETQCLIDNLDKIKKVSRCSCELGCSNTVYEVEKLNENVANEEQPLEMQFVSWPMVRYKREVLFGWVDLLVSFGGIAGLFLGFSLLSGVELMYYFTIRAGCMVYKSKHELEKIRMETELRKKQAAKRSILQRMFGRTKERKVSAIPANGNGVSTVGAGAGVQNVYNRNIIANQKVLPLRLYSNQSQYPRERFQGYPKEQFIPAQPKYIIDPYNNLPVQEINFFSSNDQFYRPPNNREYTKPQLKAPFGFDFIH